LQSDCNGSNEIFKYEMQNKSLSRKPRKENEKKKGRTRQTQ
jgi:hypothetical protein